MGTCSPYFHSLPIQLVFNTTTEVNLSHIMSFLCPELTVASHTRVSTEVLPMPVSPACSVPQQLCALISHWFSLLLPQPHWPSHCIETSDDAFPSTWKAPQLSTSLSPPLPSAVPCHHNS